MKSPTFWGASLKWDPISFVQMNQQPDWTPSEEPNCRRHCNLSYAHELVKKMKPNPKVFPLPPFVGSSSSSSWAVPWRFTAKAKVKAHLYRSTQLQQLWSNWMIQLLHSLQHWDPLKRVENLSVSGPRNGLSLLVHLFPFCCFLPWLIALVAWAVASLHSRKATSVFLFPDFWMEVLHMASLN